MLAHVRDPGNAGTVLRTADAAGAAGVIFTDASVDPYNGKCVRASAGSLFHLPVVAGARLASAVRALGGAGLRILAADSRGGRSLDEVIAAGTLRTPTAWLFGNEAWGLPDELLEPGGRVGGRSHLWPRREPQPGDRRGRYACMRRPAHMHG